MNVVSMTKTLVDRDNRRVTRWRVEITSGPDKGTRLHAASGIIRVGSAPDNELVLVDPRVSRAHLEIEIRPEGPRVRDLGSKNGTRYQGSRIEAIALPVVGGLLELGDSEILLAPDDAVRERTPVPRSGCGRLIGRSPPMLALYDLIERMGRSNASVLIHGETGTGKELAAEALHETGSRAAGPFEVVDCGAIPGELIESVLYGHVRGAFTNATHDALGAFRRANGGTLFLDEIGELALELQPKLLRALESGNIRPVGAPTTVDVDVRVIAATNRDLRAEVAAGRFRDDLYYRLSVVCIDMPPLRHRLADLPLIANAILSEIGAPPLGPDAQAVLMAHGWPGNVRQLRNVLERAVAMTDAGPLVIRPADLDLPSARLSPAALLNLPYKQAKDEMIARFTRDYLEALLQRHDGHIMAAASEARIDRNWLVALARRHGVRIRD